MVWRSAPVESGYAAFAQEDRTLPQTLRSALAPEADGAVFRVETALSPDTRVAVAANTTAWAGVGDGRAFGHLAFAGADTAVAVLRDVGPRTQLALTAQSGEARFGPSFGASRRQAMAGSLTHANGPLTAGLSFGAVREEGALLGLAWTEKLGRRPDGETAFLGLAGEWRMDEGLTLSAQAEAGLMPRAQGWLSVAEPLTTSAFALGAAAPATPRWLSALSPDARGRLEISLRQPLRIEGGALAVALPTADAWGRSSLAYEVRRFDPSPSGRELEAQAAWDVIVAGRVAARLSFTHVREPGHVAGASPENRAQIGVRVGY
jgi:hypothetical protein